MKKRVLALALVLMMSILLVIPAIAAQGQKPVLYDFAQLLSDQEAAEVSGKLELIREKFSVEVIVYTANTTQNIPHDRFARIIFDEENFGLGEDRDGILLLIDMDPMNRGWYIYGRGLGADAMTNYDIEEVGELIVPDLKDGNYANAFKIFADECEMRVDVAINGEPFSPIVTLVICLVIAFIISLIVTGVMRSQLKSVRSKYTATDYVRRGSMNVTVARDFFLYRTVSRRARPKPSNSSGGGGSGFRESGGGGSF